MNGCNLSQQQRLLMTDNTSQCYNSPKKRRLHDDVSPFVHANPETKENIATLCPVTHTPCGEARRRFLRIPGDCSANHSNTQVFQTEQWKSKQMALFVPVLSDVMINTGNIEQITFESGEFFIGDDTATYCGSRRGQVIHFWRFDEADRQLYISRSLLITDAQIYAAIRRQLEEL